MRKHQRVRRVRIRLFKANWLELNTLTPFSLFAAVWLLLLGICYGLAAWTIQFEILILCALFGLGLWCLFEYVMHRHIFHIQPRTKFLRRLQFLLHENHHQDPTDPLRGLMPLSVSLPIALLLWLAGHSIGGSAEAMVLGFVSGYVVYDTTHWACHHRPMRSALGLRLKRHHLRHHYAAPERNFAVTAIFLDRWFGTGRHRS